MGLLDDLKPHIQQMIEDEIRERSPWHTWGNVSSLEPLMVELATGAEIIAASQIAGTLEEGDRVFSMIFQGRATILGRRNGTIDRGDLQYGAMLLDTADLEGASGVSSGPVLRVPEELWGDIRRFRVVVSGSVDTVQSSEPIRPTCVHINEDANENYRWNGVAWRDGSRFINSYDSAVSYPRTMYMARYSSVMYADFYPYNTGKVSQVSWIGHGWGNTGNDKSYTFQTGGRYLGDSEDYVKSFRVGTNQSSTNWNSGSRCELWGFR